MKTASGGRSAEEMRRGTATGPTLVVEEHALDPPVGPNLLVDLPPEFFEDVPGQADEEDLADGDDDGDDDQRDPDAERVFRRLDVPDLADLSA